MAAANGACAAFGGDIESSLAPGKLADDVVCMIVDGKVTYRK